MYLAVREKEKGSRNTKRKPKPKLKCSSILFFHTVGFLFSSVLPDPSDDSSAAAAGCSPISTKWDPSEKPQNP